jgi:hypothetical protein
MAVQTPTANSLQLLLETLQKVLAEQLSASVAGVQGNPTNPQPKRPTNSSAKTNATCRVEGM